MIDWTAALNALSGQSGFSSLRLIKGTFDVSATTNVAPLVKLTSVVGAVPASAETVQVSIPASTAIPGGVSVSGQGTTVRITVQ